MSALGSAHLRMDNRTAKEPLNPHAGIAVLRGNLAPRGAIIKPAAASAHLMKHRGRAVVFESREEMHSYAALVSSARSGGELGFDRRASCLRGRGVG